MNFSIHQLIAINHFFTLLLLAIFPAPVSATTVEIIKLEAEKASSAEQQFHMPKIIICNDVHTKNQKQKLLVLWKIHLHSMCSKNI